MGRAVQYQHFQLEGVGVKNRVSLQKRMIEFFEANPQEELSRPQIMKLFHAGEKHVDNVLNELRGNGFIETVHISRFAKRNDMRKVLELISYPANSDGTWNLDREECRKIAAKALGIEKDSPD